MENHNITAPMKPYIFAVTMLNVSLGASMHKMNTEWCESVIFLMKTMSYALYHLKCQFSNILYICIMSTQ